MNRRQQRRAAGRRSGSGATSKALEAALAAHRAGRLDEAAALYRRVLDTQPRNPDALHLLGLVRNQQGDFAAAIDLIGRAIRLNPREARYHNNLGLVHAAAGATDAALDAYRRARRLDARYAEPLVNQATLYAGVEDFEAAEACLRRALDLDPRNPRIHNNLGNVLERLARADEAAQSYRRALAFQPRYAEALGNLSVVLTALGDLAEAESCCRRAIELAPDSAEAHNRLGSVLRFLGRIDEAATHYRRALECDPTLAAAYNNLSQIRKARAGDPDFQAMTALLGSASLGQEEAVLLHFGLGKMHADIGDYDAAFAHYEQANSHHRESRARLGHAFDAGRHGEQLERIRALFTGGFFAARRDFGIDSELPIFIVGMPRSGTTLVEQIIASHPAAHGAGELPGIPRLVARLEADAGAGFPEAVASLDANTATAHARDVLRTLRARAGDADRVTDKLPLNFAYLGLIALLFPRARVIHCLRDARDVCLSCYVSHFTRGNEFAYDLADLGAYHRAYRRLMAHWREALPLAMLDLSYEALVADQEAVSRRLIDFCGLPWDARCLDFHRAARPVQTTSYEQVRRPLFGTSVGRWRAYERHLGPLIEALGDPEEWR